MNFDIISEFKINSKIYVAINSYSLLLFINKALKQNDNFIYWPDGFICKLFGFDKIPGRDIFNQIIISNRKFCLVTSPHIYELFSIDIQKRIEIKEVGFKSVGEIFAEMSPILSDIVIITLPTPKQEELALLINDKYKDKTILCLGGAVNMYLGLEKKVPDLISNLGFEFIWRLHKDPIRRIKRLITLINLYKILNANIKFIKK